MLTAKRGGGATKERALCILAHSYSTPARERLTETTAPATRAYEKAGEHGGAAAMRQLFRGARHNASFCEPEGLGRHTEQAWLANGTALQNGALCSIATAIYPGTAASTGQARCLACAATTSPG
ncbi:MAG TPA: hypothetical protein VN579_02415 [Bryobacteraceae bacterium]|nr:hypothetical protein [Bryobacteraceae bacterium]